MPSTFSFKGAGASVHVSGSRGAPPEPLVVRRKGQSHGVKIKRLEHQTSIGRGASAPVSVGRSEAVAPGPDDVVAAEPWGPARIPKQAWHAPEAAEDANQSGQEHPKELLVFAHKAH